MSTHSTLQVDSKEGKHGDNTFPYTGGSSFSHCRPVRIQNFAANFVFALTIYFEELVYHWGRKCTGSKRSSKKKSKIFDLLNNSLLTSFCIFDFSCFSSILSNRWISGHEISLHAWFKTKCFGACMIFWPWYLLGEKCPYSEFLWSVISRIRTEYGEIRVYIQS